MSRVAPRESLHDGVFAEFDDPDELLHAIEHVRGLGYTDLDAFTPFPVPGASEKLGFPRSKLPWYAFGAGLGGAVFAYFIQWFTVAYNFPINVGNRPPHSPPSFVPITFETMVLWAGWMVFIAFFFFVRLPEPWNPVFEIPGFERATQDRFWLAIGSADPRFEAERTARELEELAPLRVVRLEGRDT